MQTDTINASTKNGTLGGILMVFLFQINWPGLLQTAIIAVVGTVTSFLVSLGMKYLSGKFFKKHNSEDG